MKFKSGDKVMIGNIEEDDSCATYRLCGIVDAMFDLVGKKATVVREGEQGRPTILLDNGWCFAEEDLKLLNLSLENK